MHSSPYFSVIVSVYNAADTLARCLNSLVYQSFDDIEIIVVEKESTDNSLEIIKRYAKGFPNKLYLFERPYSSSPASGRNYGISVAKGEYIAFCDADDFYELNAFEVLREYVLNNPSKDVICYNTKMRDEKKVKSIDRYKPNASKASLLQGDNAMAFWNKLFKKDLLLQCGDIPELMPDDLAFVPTILSKASDIGFVDQPLYDFILVGGVSNTRHSLKILGMTNVFEYTLNNCDAIYKDSISVSVAKRVNSSIISRWRCMDDFILWVQEHKDLFIDNELLKERPPLYNQMMKYIEGYQEWIPKTVYVNGFGNSLTDEWLEHIKGESFNFGCDTLVVLNETNCDINLNEQIRTAYKNKEYDYLGHYFAVKNIYENGGIYVGPRIRMTLSFNVLRQYPSFFAFIDENTFSDQIFGALSGNAVFRELLYTYEKSDFYDDTFCSISERIRNILVAKYSVPLNGKRFRNQDLYIVDPSQTAVDSGNGNNLCLHDFTDCINDDEYVVVKKSSLCLLGDDKNYAVLLNQKNALQKQIKDIENSDSWKLIKRLKKFAHSKIGRIPLRFFKYCVKKFRKRKYGIG